MTEDPGWTSYTPSHPHPDPPRRGQLQAIIQVLVYDDAVVPQVSFSAECALHPDSDPELIGDVVRRATAALQSWR